MQDSDRKPIGPDIPPEVTVEEMERLLDRVAIELVAIGDEGYKIVPWFEWLEWNIQERRRVDGTIGRARERVERIAEKAGVPVEDLIRGGVKRKRPGPRRK